MRTVGTTIRGIRAPIIKEGDDIVKVVVNSLKQSWESEGYELRDNDVVGVTESSVARSQGNYVSVDQVAEEARDKLGEKAGVIFPILSRNRFSLILKGMARGLDEMTLLLSYPGDEVGNALMDEERMEQLGINEHTDALSEAQYRASFTAEEVLHLFTGVDYVKFYREIIESENAKPVIIFSNNPTDVLNYVQSVLAADIHTRGRTKRKLREAGAERVFSLDDFCTKPVDSSGHNPDYGLLGSNMADEERLKLFPINGDVYVRAIQAELKRLTGKHVEVMIYGDGAFKCPQSKIWEFADPVVSPGYTDGLRGTPNELKMKYFADTELKELKGEAAAEKMRQYIREKDANLVGSMNAEGTTPRQLTDLLGSLFDLTSGSGDKGTPIVLVQGYFDNYASK